MGEHKTTRTSSIRLAPRSTAAGGMRAQTQGHPRAEELFDPDNLPGFHDPFCGGGALPLEAQRLGLDSRASDLNPVAVLITKAMIEIPPKFADEPPVNPDAREERSLIAREWTGAQGLAEDVRYYGHWMRDRGRGADWPPLPQDRSHSRNGKLPAGS